MLSVERGESPLFCALFGYVGIASSASSVPSGTWGQTWRRTCVPVCNFICILLFLSAISGSC